MQWGKLAGAAATAILSCIAVAAAETPAERGAYLVTTISACGNCHTPKEATGISAIPGAELSGGYEYREGFGHAIVPNITPDPETGIGKWTDAQIMTALRDGKRPDGRTLGPPMPFFFYRRISDDDAGAIVAYLHTVKPIKHAVGPSEYTVKLPDSYGPPVEHVTAPPKTDKVAYGAYLAGPIAHCLDCHTPFASPGKLDLDRLGAGGRELHIPGSYTEHVISRNITPDPEDGIGKWSDADIKRAITQGVRPDGTKLVRTMAFDWYKNIAPADLDALVAYLRSMKPQKTR